jgi:2-haloacid dehalogenase
MEGTGLISYFEMVLSAESVKKYKPCDDVYQWAAKKLEVNPSDCLLISAHGWDIAGAAYAGMQTAYLKHNTQQLYPLAPTPAITCKSLADLAHQISKEDSSI